MFRVGEQVVCVKVGNTRVGKVVTKGKKYTVMGIHRHDYLPYNIIMVMNDNNRRDMINSEWFITPKEYRKRKVKRILCLK